MALLGYGDLFAELPGDPGARLERAAWAAVGDPARGIEARPAQARQEAVRALDDFVAHYEGNAGDPRTARALFDIRRLANWNREEVVEEPDPEAGAGVGLDAGMNMDEMENLGIDTPLAVGAVFSSQLAKA